METNYEITFGEENVQVVFLMEINCKDAAKKVERP